MLGSVNVIAGFAPAVDNHKPCPVHVAYPDNMSLDGATMLVDVPTDQVIDAEFGAGAQAITQPGSCSVAPVAYWQPPATRYLEPPR